MILQATIILLIPAAVTRTTLGQCHRPKTGCTRSGPKSGPAIVWQAPGPGTERLPDHRPGDEVDPHVHLPYVWEMHRQIGHQSFVRILSGDRELDHTQDNPFWGPLGICCDMTLGPDLQSGEGNVQDTDMTVRTLFMHVSLAPPDMSGGKLKIPVSYTHLTLPTKRIV